MPTLSEIQEILNLVTKFIEGAEPEEHTVFVNGTKTGTCIRATAEDISTLLGGFKVKFRYSYQDGETTTHHYARVRAQGLGKGGREQIEVNSKEVFNDDVILGTTELDGVPAISIEFRYSLEEGGDTTSVKYVVPVSAL